jgi:hypothetical protein
MQIIHILVHWNPLKNWDKIHKKFVVLIIATSVTVSATKSHGFRKTT